MPESEGVYQLYFAVDADKMYWNVNGEWIFMGTLQHGLLDELDGDSHPQYFNESRLDDYLDNVDSLPTPSAAYRGKIWVVPGGTGSADTAYICIKDASDNYVWQAL